MWTWTARTSARLSPAGNDRREEVRVDWETDQQGIATPYVGTRNESDGPGETEVYVVENPVSCYDNARPAELGR
jgi:hypothetical protein